MACPKVKEMVIATIRIYNISQPGCMGRQEGEVEKSKYKDPYILHAFEILILSQNSGPYSYHMLILGTPCSHLYIHIN